MYPRFSDDTDQCDRGHTPARVQFKYACDALVSAVRAACVWDVAEGRAVWYARHVAHEAKRLGLYREPVDVRVLIDLDVEAGEEHEESRVGGFPGSAHGDPTRGTTR